MHETFHFGIDFGQAGDGVLLFAAFLLGTYSRLTNDVLGRNASSILGTIFRGIHKEDQWTIDGTSGPEGRQRPGSGFGAGTRSGAARGMSGR